MSRIFSVISCLLCLFRFASAQLALPNPPWSPPNATFGTQPSDSSNESVNSHWASILGSTLYFYEEQRSGNLPSTNRVPWRNDSATDDGKDVGVDLSGGYYDAGGTCLSVLIPVFDLLERHRLYQVYLPNGAPTLEPCRNPFSHISYDSPML